MAPLLAFILIAAPQNAELARLQAQNTELQKKPWPEVLQGQPKLNEAVFRLAERNALKTAEDYRIASDLLAELNHLLVTAEAKYELGFTAVVLGDLTARKPLAANWDALMMDLGRHRPIGAIKSSGEFPLTGHWITDPAPEAVRKVWSGETIADPDAKDNEEVAAMFKEDQAIREKVDDSREGMMKMMKDDAARLDRIKAMVAANELGTAEDYYRAAFLYQHGGAFEEYQMAHQLAVCSVLLGKEKAKWIGAATYDRMLGSCGHDQRWATQYRVVSGVTKPMPCGTVGIGDAERKAVVGLTLAEAMKRKF